MIHLRTPSRLHFGLIAPAAIQGRRFGGVGLMVEEPSVELRVEPSAVGWHVQGPSADRANLVLQRLLDRPEARDWAEKHLEIVRAVPEHRGLGAGTQLALALGRAAEGLRHVDAAQLACWVGRGTRSALGIHGFERGGFLVDGGKDDSDVIAPLIVRMDFPTDWPIVLVLPDRFQGLHGEREWEAFDQLDAAQQGRTDQLCRLVLLGLLPALAERDFAEFAENLHHFNRLAGEAFRAVQAGVYASLQVHEHIDYLRSLGVKGVGQSSWGPCVFVLACDAEHAAWVIEKVRGRFRLAAHELLITKADNQGARVWTE